MAATVTESAAEATVAARTGTSLVDWRAVIAGALLASALSFVLLTFGTSIGLSATSPWPNSGLSARVIASLAAFWVLAQQIGSFLVGGYVAGRLRAPSQGLARDDSSFRDGLHGALVWALGIALGTALALAAAGALARGGMELGARGAASANPADLALDTLLRAAPGGGAGQSEAPAREARAEISPHPGKCGRNRRPYRSEPRLSWPARSPAHRCVAARGGGAHQSSNRGDTQGSRHGQTRRRPDRLPDGSIAADLAGCRVVGSGQGRAAS